MRTFANVADPRLQPDFDPSYLPLCDGGPLPLPGVEDVFAGRMIEFAAIYYAMNRAMDAAQAARAQKDVLAEREALRRICQLSTERDALEDRYAPEGFLAEPLLSEGFYVNLMFTWSGKPDAVLYLRRFETTFTL